MKSVDRIFEELPDLECSVVRVGADMGTLTAGEIKSGNITISADLEQMRFGSATDPVTGTGIFMGLSSGDYEFRVGDPSGENIHWDGSALSVGGTVTADSFVGSNPVFSESVDFQGGEGGRRIRLSSAVGGGVLRMYDSTATQIGELSAVQTDQLTLKSVSGNDVSVQGSASTRLDLISGGDATVEAATDVNLEAGNATGVLSGVYIMINGSLAQIEAGAEDSGGTGHRVLRVDN